MECPAGLPRWIIMTAVAGITTQTTAVVLFATRFDAYERISPVLQLAGNPSGETEADNECCKCSIIAKLSFLIPESKHKLLTAWKCFDKILANVFESIIVFRHTEKPAVECHQIVFRLRLLTLRRVVAGRRGAAVRVIQQLQQPRLEVAELRTVTVAVMVDNCILQR